MHWDSDGRENDWIHSGTHHTDAACRQMYHNTVPYHTICTVCIPYNYSVWQRSMYRTPPPPHARRPEKEKKENSARPASQPAVLPCLAKTWEDDPGPRTIKYGNFGGHSDTPSPLHLILGSLNSWGQDEKWQNNKKRKRGKAWSRKGMTKDGSFHDTVARHIIQRKREKRAHHRNEQDQPTKKGQDKQ